jgi:hypothetical protein
MFFQMQYLLNKLAVELRVEIDLEEQINLQKDELIEMVNTLAAENLELIYRAHYRYDVSSKAHPSTILFRSAILARIHELKGDIDDPLRQEYPRAY